MLSICYKQSNLTSKIVKQRKKLQDKLLVIVMTLMSILIINLNIKRSSFFWFWHVIRMWNLEIFFGFFKLFGLHALANGDNPQHLDESGVRQTETDQKIALEKNSHRLKFFCNNFTYAYLAPKWATFTQINFYSLIHPPYIM